MEPEEIANALTHGVGLAFSIAGLVVLVIVAALHGSVVNIVSCCVYGGTLVCLYCASTIYHTTVSPRWKHILKIADHCCIYLLIAGTYTPFALLALRGAWGWSIFGVIWGLALFGIIQDTLAPGRRILSVVIYLLMGWLALVAIRPLARALPGAALAGLVAGGVLYTAGVLFYALGKKISFGHEIFHLFVLAGSACHYFTILLYVA